LAYAAPAGGRILRQGMDVPYAALGLQRDAPSLRQIARRATLTWRLQYRSPERAQKTADRREAASVRGLFIFRGPCRRRSLASRSSASRLRGTAVRQIGFEPVSAHTQPVYARHRSKFRILKNP
jgi:hypothetical protein